MYDDPQQSDSDILYTCSDSDTTTLGGGDGDHELTGLDNDKTPSLWTTPKRPRLSTSELGTSGGSSHSELFEEVYVTDPDCTPGVVPQTQPGPKHGISYTPLGLKMILVAKRKTLRYEKD